MPGRIRTVAPCRRAKAGDQAPVALKTTGARASPALAGDAVDASARPRRARPRAPPRAPRSRSAPRRRGPRAESALSTQSRWASMPHSSKVTAPCSPGRSAGLEPVELVGGEPHRGLAALERLVDVVGGEEDLGGVGHRPLDQALPLPPRGEGEQEGDAEEQVRRQPLDVAGVAAGQLGDPGAGEHVARPAVDHPRAAARGAGGQVAALEQQHRQPAHGAVARRAQAVHPAPEDDDVVAHEPPDHRECTAPGRVRDGADGVRRPPTWAARRCSSRRGRAAASRRRRRGRRS